MALFVDLVALSNGLHGSVQMDSVAPPPWNTHIIIFITIYNKESIYHLKISHPLIKTTNFFKLARYMLIDVAISDQISPF